MTQVFMYGMLLIVIVSLLAAGLVFVVQKIMPKERREGEVEAIGFVFAVVGVLYAIVLAFVVIDVWTKMTATKDNVGREAGALVEEYRYAQGLPDPERLEIQRLARAYASHVITNEWPQMRARKPVSIDGYAILDQLRSAIESSQPGDSQAAEEAYLRAQAQSEAIAIGRQERLSAAQAGVPAVLWFVLLGGGLLMIGFAYVFDIAGRVTQLILVIGLTVMTALLLWSIFELEYPFSRQLRITPSAFEFALARFIQIGGGGQLAGRYPDCPHRMNDRTGLDRPAHVWPRAGPELNSPTQQNAVAGA